MKSYAGEGRLDPNAKDKARGHPDGGRKRDTIVGEADGVDVRNVYAYGDGDGQDGEQPSGSVDASVDPSSAEHGDAENIPCGTTAALASGES